MAYYEPTPEEGVEEGAATYAATEHTGSPWAPGVQHGGPVAALLTRALDRCAPRPETRLARVSVELLGPVPIGGVRVAARVERPGRRIELLGATLEARLPDGGWRPVALARAWRLATQDTADAVHHAIASMRPRAGSDPGLVEALPEAWRRSGFVATLDWRLEAPADTQDRAAATPASSATAAWIRLTEPLVAGEPTTALEQAMAIADVANGIGARLDPAAFSFLNTDLTVHLHQPPTGCWYGLQAETSVGADGHALSRAALHDERGPIGTIAQAVLVERRGATTG